MAADLLLALLLPACAQAAPLSQNTQTALDDGLRHLYNLDYEKSRASFRKLVELEPDNPYGYLFESGAIWWQASQEYGLFKGTPTLQGLFEQDVEAAIRKADPWTDSKDKSVKADGHFAMGMALGTRGQWSLMKGHYVRAYLDGKKALKELKRTLKADDEYFDAYLGLGVFDYQAARASGFARLGSILGGMRGDEERGLVRMRKASENGRMASRQAAQFLASVYIMDKRDWASALPLVERLRRDFPQSVYFESLELLLTWKLGRKERSLALGRTIFQQAKADPKAFNRKLLSMVCGLAGDRCLSAEQAGETAAWLTAALETLPPPAPAKKGAKPAPPGEDEAYRALLRLYRGYCLGILGKKDEADADFHAALKGPELGDSHARAKRCLEHGCPSEELLTYLRDQSTR